MKINVNLIRVYWQQQIAQVTKKKKKHKRDSFVLCGCGVLVLYFAFMKMKGIMGYRRPNSEMRFRVIQPGNLGLHI